MYRVGLEELLGFQLRGDRLAFDPVVPGDWDGVTLRYRTGEGGGTVYEVTIRNPERVNRGVVRVEADGQHLPDGEVPIVVDGGTHRVVVTLGGGRRRRRAAGRARGSGRAGRRRPRARGGWRRTSRQRSRAGRTQRAPARWSPRGRGERQPAGRERPPGGHAGARRPRGVTGGPAGRVRLRVRRRPGRRASAPSGDPLFLATTLAGLEDVLADEVRSRLPAARVRERGRGRLILEAPDPRRCSVCARRTTSTACWAASGSGPTAPISPP